MEKFISATIRRSAHVIVLVFTLCFFKASSQQYIIADKDNTHPEIKTRDAEAGFITRLSAERANGYNEISWTAFRENDVRKYIIEYSTNGVDFQSAGEVISGTGSYTFKHHLLDNGPAIYRIKMEQLNNRFFYSPGIVLLGANLSPVKIYPTIVQGNMININASWPVEKINVYSSNGAQVFSKDLNGQSEHISLVLPSLSPGTYWMAFQGRGWRTTEKFMMQ
jgi:hypothetical protein